MNRRQAIIGAATVVGAGLLARVASAQTKITIMVFPGTPNLPLFAAQSNGFFAKRDLAVEMKYGPIPTSSVPVSPTAASRSCIRRRTMRSPWSRWPRSTS